MPERINIMVVPASDAGLRRLIAELDSYLSGLYPADEIFAVDLEAAETREMIFAVAYTDGKAVGCGAIRRLDEAAAELKRFYVLPECRRSGIAGELCRFLEKRCREQGIAVLRLETGAPQYESLGFYRKQGFYGIDRYGEYVHCESSLCMEKRLTDTANETINPET
ncbi:GNAT family N-acetyltransferase [Paenibacillus sp. HB172176]|uniref:GNAT family N-acetyltransferase n=1 Tax=Paenibacillus sp. HB172176 TaxID=2493690 RepID=UPI001F0D405A|nr:GNAT family N-acetyltransferase [Paenibacillus sp. HB172176]